MMKKSTLLIMVIFLITILIYSCDKDEFKQEDAYKYENELLTAESNIAIRILQDSTNLVKLRDSLRHQSGIVNYSVMVVDAGDAGIVKSGQKAKGGLWQATVTVNQNGYKKTVVTDKSGIAVFPDLRIGEVVVNVRSDGYTSASFIAQIKAEWDMSDPNWSVPVGFKIPLDGNYYGVLRNAATMIPLFAMQGYTMSTIKGQVTYETDLTNAEPEKAYGVEVVGVIDTDDPDFKLKYLGSLANGAAGNGLPYCQDCLSGKIIKIAYGDIVSRGIDNYSPYDVKGFNKDFSNITNSNGEYTLKVPSTADGLPIKIVVSEIARDQYLLMNKKYGDFVYGIQQVRTIFSSEVDGITAGAVPPSPIPAVPAAYCVFSEPSHLTGGQPSVEATATVVLSSSGIEFINVINQGDGYTQAPIVVVSQAEDNGRFNTSCTAVANIVEGKVVSVTILDPGRGYHQPGDVAGTTGDTGAGTPFTYPAIAVSFNVPENNAAGLQTLIAATANPVVSYAIVNSITAATANTPLAAGLVGYAKKPYNPAVAVNADNGTGAVLEAVTLQYVDEVVLNNKGIGYTAAPTVLLRGGSPAYPANAAGVGTKVTANMTALNPIYAINDVNIVYPGGAPVLFDRVPDVLVTDASVPTVGTGAKVSVELNATGGVNKIYITDAGEGYSLIQGEEPTVEITSKDGFGWGAAAHAVTIPVAPAVNPLGKILTIVVDYPGEGYKSAPDVRIQAPKVEAGKTNSRQATAYAGFGRKVAKLTVTDNGSGYTEGKTAISIQGTTANTVITRALVAGEFTVVYDKSISSFTFVDANVDTKLNTRGYVTTPEVVIVPVNGQGMNASATAVLKQFVTALNVKAEGSGYRHYDTNLKAVIDAPNGNVGIPVAIPNSSLGKGVVESVTVTNPGLGYIASPVVNLFIDANANGVWNAGETRIAYNITATVRDNKVYQIKAAGGLVLQGPSVVAPGTYAIEILTKGTTALAGAKAYPSTGQITAIMVTNPGRGYTQAPIVEIVDVAAGTPGLDGQYANSNGSTLGAGTGAVAHAEIIDGRVSKVVIDNPGVGYWNPAAVAVVFSVPSYNKRAVGIPIISADGRITGVDFGATSNLPTATATNDDNLDPGAANGTLTLQYPLTRGMGYDPMNPPSVTFFPSVPGKGANATGTCVVRNGRIDAVVMTNQGGSYLGHNRYVAVCLGRSTGIPLNNIGATENGALGLGFQVSPYIGVAYGYLPTGATNVNTPTTSTGTGSGTVHQGDRFVTEAGKTYIKDIYLGTGKRSIDMQP